MTGKWRPVAAASVGNALEWLSFTAYTLVGATIAKEFFPSQDETSSLILAFGTVGLSYIVRPIGALVLGAYADRAGRMPALMISIRIMVLATLIITFLPGYSTIGIAAPIGMVLAMLLQGFSAGGEFGSATGYLVEQNANRRGFMASWQGASQAFATVLATLLLAITSSTLTDAQFEAWGWRVPFAFGLLLGPVGYYIRKNLSETTEFSQARRTTELKHPVAQTLRSQKTRIVLSIGILAVSTAYSYLITYMPTYAIRQYHLPASTSFAAVVITSSIMVLIAPLAGHVSDIVGRTKMLTIAAVGIAVTSIPLFLLFQAAPSFATMAIVMTLMGLIKPWYTGPLSARMAELFPTATRGTGLSISYNLGVILFGGLTPVAVTWLLATLETPLAPAFWLTALAVLSLVGALASRRYIRAKSQPNLTSEHENA
ncbi:MFS transporter [Saccharopolyspora shandongensis]|uniref:MFS transporter, MHS family, proline/betaine transporter n=1 Tax=Saccharopolyspora shandongensis TaxID=418495 RepID=A0A1H2R621_9PSEU|nr:MFS transporter [Saccharopolyspora shandongensis]SDW14801.1 MFS transporter, MHS family, proline/betaine transporter [Saccharopolyspora shandongensis]